MLERRLAEQAPLSGYDDLKLRSQNSSAPYEEYSFAPNRAYDAYLKIHKVFVGEVGGKYLENLGSHLQNERMPQYLDAAGWAFAESALVRKEGKTIDRIHLLDRAEDSWQRALIAQDDINNSDNERLCEDSAPFRLALNLAFAPLMKAIVLGDVTDSVREQVFANTLAVAQASQVQRTLAKCREECKCNERSYWIST